MEAWRFVGGGFVLIGNNGLPLGPHKLTRGCKSGLGNKNQLGQKQRLVICAAMKAFVRALEKSPVFLKKKKEEKSHVYFPELGSLKKNPWN